MNLENVYKVWSNYPNRILILGYFKPKSYLYSLIIQIQYPINNEDCYYYQDEEGLTRHVEDLQYDNNNLHLMVYVLNFDNTYKLISTGLLGEFIKDNTGLSKLEIVPAFSIKKNRIIVKEKTTQYPTDIVLHNSKSNPIEKKIYKISINKKGQIEK